MNGIFELNIFVYLSRQSMINEVLKTETKIKLNDFILS
jgi:hypothetical protein